MAPTTTLTTPTHPTRRKPHRRPARTALALIGSAEPASAPDAEDERPAELVADLAALMEAGFIVPVEQHGAVRYAVIDPDSPAA